MLTDALGGRALLAGFAMLNVLIVARAVGPSTYGLYATALTYATLLGVLTDLGSAGGLVREGVLSEDRQAVTRTYVHVRVVLIAATTLVGAALVPIAFPAEAHASAWLALLMLVFSGSSLVAPMGQLHGSMRVFRHSALMQGGLNAALTLAVVLAWGDPSAFLLVAATVVAAVPATGYALLATRGWTGRIMVAPDRPAMRSMLRSITLLGTGQAFTTLYGRIDTVLLLNLGGAHAAGLYAAAVRLLDQSAMIPMAALVPIGPMIATQLRRGRSLSPSFDAALARLAIVGGLGVAWFTIGAAHWAALLLLGPGFDETGTLTAILAVYGGWSLLAYLATTKVFHAGLDRRYVVIAIAGLALNVGVNVALIPPYGAHGAAAATLVTELATVTALVIASRETSVARYGRALLVMGAGGAAAAALAIGVPAAWPASRPIISAALCAAGLALLWRGVGIVRTDIEATGRIAEPEAAVA